MVWTAGVAAVMCQRPSRCVRCTSCEDAFALQHLLEDSSLGRHSSWMSFDIGRDHTCIHIWLAQLCLLPKMSLGRRLSRSLDVAACERSSYAAPHGLAVPAIGCVVLSCLCVTPAGFIRVDVS
jgi:hypothetical protein